MTVYANKKIILVLCTMYYLFNENIKNVHYSDSDFYKIVTKLRGFAPI